MLSMVGVQPITAPRGVFDKALLRRSLGSVSNNFSLALRWQFR
jgi:hypothetical protein